MSTTQLSNAARLSRLLEDGRGATIPVPAGLSPHARALYVLRLARIIDVAAAEHPALRVALFVGEELEPPDADAELAFVVMPPAEPT
jgi:hypothetical protein